MSPTVLLLISWASLVARAQDPDLSASGAAVQTDMPLTEDGALALIRQLADEQRYGDLLERIGPVVAQHPDSATLHEINGLMMLVQVRLDEAAAELTLASALAPDEPDIHTELALVLELDGRLALAQAAAQRALALDPTHVDAVARLDHILLRQRLEVDPRPVAPPADSAARAIYDLATSGEIETLQEMIWEHVEPAALDRMIAESMPGETPSEADRQAFVRGVAQAMNGFARFQGTREIRWAFPRPAPIDRPNQVVVELAIDVIPGQALMDRLGEAARSGSVNPLANAEGIAAIRSLDDAQREVILRRAGEHTWTLAGQVVFDMVKQDGTWKIKDLRVNVEGLPQTDLAGWSRLARRLSPAGPSWAYRAGEAMARALEGLILVGLLLAFVKGSRWVGRRFA